MDDFQQRIFLREVAWQSQLAVEAILQANAVLKEMADSIGAGSSKMPDTSKLFVYLDDFIDHTGRVSLLLFPNKGNSKKAVRRGSELRDILNVGNDSILSERSLRNNLQHYDERLDRWASERDPDEGYVDRTIGRFGQFSGIGIPMRHFDPGNNNYYFRGSQYDIQSLCFLS